MSQMKVIIYVHVNCEILPTDWIGDVIVYLKGRSANRGEEFANHKISTSLKKNETKKYRANRKLRN